MDILKVVSELPGTGKSYWILNKLNEWRKEGRYDQFVYVTPFLDICGGVRSNGKFIQGEVQTAYPDMKFRYPIPRNGSKLEDIKSLLVGCENISTTHSLFSNVDKECIEIIRQNKNILVIDEEVEPFRKVSGFTSKDIDLLVRHKILECDPTTKKLSWNHSAVAVDDKPFSYDALARLCDTGCAYLLNKEIILWQFSADVLKAFDEVYVVSYLFENSIMDCWCKINGITTQRVIPDNPQLRFTTQQAKLKLRSLLEFPTVRGPTLDKFSLSVTWWNNANKEHLGDIIDYVDNIRKNHLCPKGYTTKDMLITCPKNRWFKEVDTEEDSDGEDVLKMRTKGLIKAPGLGRIEWAAATCRATNKYRDKKLLVYLMGKYPAPHISQFCRDNGFPVDEDNYIISNLIQWVFRGSCRDGNPMVVFIASKRVRDLFMGWLESND